MGSGPPPSSSSRLSQCKFSSSPMIEIDQLADEIEWASKRIQRLLKQAGKK
jgi:hypothetical protein